MNTAIKVTEFCSKQTTCVYVRFSTGTRFFFFFIAGASRKSLYHLVRRHGELLQLYVKLGLRSGLPAAKKKKNSTSHVTPIMTYIKDLSLCKAQKEAETKMSPFPLLLMPDDDIIGTGRASHG